MLLKNKPFERVEPERDAEKIYIFCEGKDREYNYFKFFRGIDTHLNIIVYELEGTEDNSPRGLFNLAEKSLLKSGNNPNPKFDYREEDKVWIVIDRDKDKMDSRKQPLIDLRSDCMAQKWNIAQSNPCFEVWLYYHIENNIPTLQDIGVCKNWKPYLDSIVKGGFDPRKHPILIKTAVINAENNFSSDNNGFPDIATTEMYKLAKQILSIGKIKDTIESLLKRQQD